LLSAILHTVWISRVNRITGATYLSSRMLIHVDCVWHGSSLGGMLCQLIHPSHQFLLRTSTIFRAGCWHMLDGIRVVSAIYIFQNTVLKRIYNGKEKWAVNTTLWLENPKGIDICGSALLVHVWKDNIEMCLNGAWFQASAAKQIRTALF